jgi:hypothetical protein
VAFQSMKPGISFTKVWADDDAFQLRVQVSDGQSVFVNEVYVGRHELTRLLVDLRQFQNHVYGGIYDMTFGSFGPEYADGAFHARLHFQDRGILFITVKSQSDFENFGKKNVAGEATLYLRRGAGSNLISDTWHSQSVHWSGVRNGAQAI